MNRPNLIVTHEDARRLGELLDSTPAAAAPMATLLEEELMRAELVASADVPADIVTMNSRVHCRDEASGQEREIELVYPHEVDAGRTRVSVLAPVGAALLGLRAGQSIDWPLPGGRMTRMQVLAVPYQPEAARFSPAR